MVLLATEFEIYRNIKPVALMIIIIIMMMIIIITIIIITIIIRIIITVKKLFIPNLVEKVDENPIRAKIQLQLNVKDKVY